MSDQPPMGRGVMRVQRQRARDWAAEAAEPPPTAPPVNVDIPYVAQAGSTLTCTMGNWEGTPTAYSYQWIEDETVGIGGDDAVYVVTPADVGRSVTCVVTATNELGSTIAPPSNPVIVV
jgi:hypothetical protein